MSFLMKCEKEQRRRGNLPSYNAMRAEFRIELKSDRLRAYKPADGKFTTLPRGIYRESVWEPENLLEAWQLQEAYGVLLAQSF